MKTRQVTFSVPVLNVNWWAVGKWILYFSLIFLGCALSQNTGWQLWAEATPLILAGVIIGLR